MDDKALADSGVSGFRGFRGQYTEFTYNAQDRPTKLTLGNAAYTDYGYDTQGRLSSFDAFDDSASRMVKHNWAYDGLGRKGDLTVTSSVSGFPAGPIDVTYDSANRLSREKLDKTGGTEWDVQYAYDDAGNRTTYNPGTGTTMTYGTGNRKLGTGY